MGGRVAGLWRHPLKSHGREALTSVLLHSGGTLPWDRRWAVIHEASHVDAGNPAWAPCANFATGARNPALMAITARLDAEGRSLALSHPDRPQISFRPDERSDVWRFLDWLEPLIDPAQPRPAGIVRLPGRGMTDTEYASVSILSLSSLAALSEAAGTALSPARFRGNIWLDGLPPWAEFGLTGREIAIGSARLRVVEPIRRCRATTANPETGAVDLDTLALLESGWGHRDFGIYAEVVAGGEIALGDPMQEAA